MFAEGWQVSDRQRGCPICDRRVDVVKGDHGAPQISAHLAATGRGFCAGSRQRVPSKVGFEESDRAEAERER